VLTWLLSAWAEMVSDGASTQTRSPVSKDCQCFVLWHSLTAQTKALSRMSAASVVKTVGSFIQIVVTDERFYVCETPPVVLVALSIEIPSVSFVVGSSSVKAYPVIEQ